MESKPEILAFQIEIYSPIEIIDPRVTRYSVNKKFSKLVWDYTHQSWRAISRATGRSALIGPNNVKGVILIEATQPAVAKLQESPQLTSELIPESEAPQPVEAAPIQEQPQFAGPDSQKLSFKGMRAVATPSPRARNRVLVPTENNGE